MTKYLSIQDARQFGRRSAIASAMFVTDQPEAEAVGAVLLHTTCMILSGQHPAWSDGYMSAVRNARAKHRKAFALGVADGVRLIQSIKNADTKH